MYTAVNLFQCNVYGAEAGALSLQLYRGTAYSTEYATLELQYTQLCAVWPLLSAVPESTAVNEIECNAVFGKQRAPYDSGQEATDY